MPDNQVAPAMMDGEEEIEPLQRATSSIQDGEDCDPYIKITIPSLRQSRETSHKPHDRNPDWNETLTFHGVTGRTELLDIAVLVRCLAPARTAAQEPPLLPKRASDAPRPLPRSFHRTTTSCRRTTSSAARPSAPRT